MCKCGKRLPPLMLKLGFKYTDRGWYRDTDNGRVMLDLHKNRHSRMAILALLCWIFQ